MLRLAAAGDLHVGADSVGQLRDGFAALADEADVLLLAGDLTKRGQLAEADVLTGELSDLPVPSSPSSATTITSPMSNAP